MRHDRLRGCSAPLVVHVGCVSAGKATIVMPSVEKSPSGIWKASVAAAFAVIVALLVTETTIEPTSPQPRAALAAPLCRETMDAPVSAPPGLMVGARSTEFPQTSKVIPDPACTLRALPDPAMCTVQFVVLVTNSTPSRACAAGTRASANTPTAVNVDHDAFAPRHFSIMLIMGSPPVAPINDGAAEFFSRPPRRRNWPRHFARLRAGRTCADCRP